MYASIERLGEMRKRTKKGHFIIFASPQNILYIDINRQDSYQLLTIFKRYLSDVS